MGWVERVIWKEYLHAIKSFPASRLYECTRSRDAKRSVLYRSDRGGSKTTQTSFLDVGQSQTRPFRANLKYTAQLNFSHSTQPNWGGFDSS